MMHTQKVKPKVVLSYLICKGGNTKHNERLCNTSCACVMMLYVSWRASGCGPLSCRRPQVILDGNDSVWTKPDQCCICPVSEP